MGFRFLFFMVRDIFLQRKKDILKKLDKSSIGGWDKKIVGLCEEINKSEDFYTTSSCSGRIVLMIEQSKKSPNLFVKVWHDKINFEELKKVLINISESSTPPTATPIRSQGSLKNALASRRVESKTKINEKDKFVLINLGLKNKIIKFKLEQPIIHIACRDIELASDFLEKAKHVGFKRSGILTAGKNIVLELNSTEKLEFPILKDGEILVDDEFLKLVIEISNGKLENGWDKIEKLEKLV